MNWVSNGSGDGLSPVRRPVILRISAELLFVDIIGTRLNDDWIQISMFSFKKMHLKMQSTKIFTNINVLTFINRFINTNGSIVSM